MNEKAEDSTKINKQAAMQTVQAQPTPAAQEPAPQLPAKADAFAVATPESFLAQLTAPAEADAKPSESDLPPYLTFLHGMQKAEVRMAAMAALGAVPDGTPYLFKSPGTVYAARDLHFLRVKPSPFHYWSSDDDDGNEERIAERRPLDNGWKERYRGVLLAVGPSLPGGIMAITISLKQATCGVAAGLHDAIAASQSAQWVQQNGSLGKVPPDFRVAGRISSQQRAVKNGQNAGRNYTQAGIICTPTPMPVLEAVMRWVSLPEAQEEYARCVAWHNRTVARLREPA